MKQKAEIENEYDVDCPNRDYQIMIRLVYDPGTFQLYDPGGA